MALREWSDLRAGGRRDGFERALAGFDLFILHHRVKGDMDSVCTVLRIKVVYLQLLTDGQILERLDMHYQWARVSIPGVDELSPRQKAEAVARHIRRLGWIGIQDERQYHNIEHNFIGLAVFSSGKHRCLPLINVVVYCYILRQFGLQAAPCSFPFHVHAVIRPPPGIDLDGNPRDDDAEAPSMYMDPFHSDEEVPVEHLNQILNNYSHRIPQSSRASFLSEADAREITMRCARNILNSASILSPRSSTDLHLETCKYAAFWALLLLNPSAGDLRQDSVKIMHKFTQQFEHDVPLVEKYLLPRIAGFPDQENYHQVCRLLREVDAKPRPVKPRFGTDVTGVRYKVGQVFKHRRYSYLAVVTGWDATCMQSEEWIQAMRVDDLPKGRDQSFYNTL